MRYTLKRCGNQMLPKFGWKKKSHAEHWIMEHLEMWGGLEWRVGGMFKARHDNVLEVVYSRSGKSVPWCDVKPEEYDYEACR